MEDPIISDRATRLTNAGVERRVLACIYKSQDAWLDSSSIVADDWGNPLNRALWYIMDALYQEKVPLSPVTVAERVPNELRAELEAQGGWKVFETWQELPINPKAVTSYIKELQAYTVRRRARAAGSKIELLAETEENPKKVIEGAEEFVAEIEGPVAPEGRLMGAEGEEYLQKLIANKNKQPGIPSGFDGLDESLDGFEPSSLIVIAGWLKSGKSALMLNWAKHQAIDKNIPILYISTEQTWEQEYRRLLAITSGVREKIIKRGAFTENERWMIDVEEATEKIKAAPMHFLHTKEFTPEYLSKVVMKYKRLHGIEAFYFDYIRPGDNKMTDDNRWGQVGKLAYGLKEIGDKFSIPVITGVQINRQGAQELRFGNGVGAEFFAESIDIGRSMSVGMSIRKLNKDEGKQYFETSDTLYRVIEVNENRHGPASYRAVVEFSADVITMKEKELLR